MKKVQIKTTFTPDQGKAFVSKSDIINSVEISAYQSKREIVNIPARSFEIIEQHRAAYGAPAFQILEVEEQYARFF